MQRSLLICALSFASLFACNNKIEASESANQASQDQFYRVRILPGSIKIGQKSQTIIEIVPSSGFKINTEFPALLKLSANPALQYEKTQLTRSEAEISEAAIRFNVSFVPSAAGLQTLKAVADFSVCNDNTCKLIRGESLSWEVKVDSH